MRQSGNSDAAVEREKPDADGMRGDLPDGPVVALVTEGSYPCGGGGVSVWCDQLIRSLPGTAFHLIAFTLTDRDPRIWAPPSNLLTTRQVGVWDRANDRLNPGSGAPLPRGLRDFVRHLTEPAGGTLEEQADAFERVFDEVLDLAVEDELAPFLHFEDLFDPVMQALKRSPHLRTRYEVSIADGLAVTAALAHLLIPLTVDPGPVDLVHATANGLPALVGIGARARRATPFMMSEHGLYLRERFLAADEELHRPVVKDVMLHFHMGVAALAYRRADLLTPASSFNRRWQLAMGADPSRALTLYNGVDPDMFPARSNEVDRPDAVWLGRVDPVKDLHTLIRAAAEVRTQIPDVRFRLFGEEPAGSRGYLASCLDLVAELHLTETVHFEGRVSHPAEAFHSGQFSVLSSITEGFPYSVLESMSCGVPVVGTSVGGVPEAIAETGLVVPPKDPRRLAAACLWMLRAGSTRNRLGKAARRRVEQLFALESMVTRHDDVYRILSVNGEVEVIDLRDRDGDAAWPVDGAPTRGSRTMAAREAG